MTPQTCQRRGCEDPATHELKMEVPDKASDRVGATSMGIFLCEPHLEEATPEEFLAVNGDVLRQVLTIAMGADYKPDFTRADLVGVSVHSPEYQALERVRDGRRPN